MIKKIVFFQLLFISLIVYPSSEEKLNHAIDNLKCKELMFLLSKVELTKEQKHKLHSRARDQVAKREVRIKSVLNSPHDLLKTGIGLTLVIAGARLSYMLINNDKCIKKYADKFSSYLHVLGDQSRDESKLKYFADLENSKYVAYAITHGFNGCLALLGLVHTYKGLTNSHAHKKFAEAQAIAGCIAHMCN